MFEAFAPSRDENVTQLNLDESWVVRKYKYTKDKEDGGYYLLYHHHPEGEVIIRESRFKKPGRTGATLGLVASPPGVSNKAVGHAKCLVCNTLAPTEALGFLEMCKWER